MPQFFASASGHYPSIPEKILGGIMGQAGEQSHGNDTKQENNTRTQEEVIPQWSQLIPRVTNNSSNPHKSLWSQAKELIRGQELHHLRLLL